MSIVPTAGPVRTARAAIVHLAAVSGLMVGSAEASVVMQIICDNDFALYAGTATGVTRKVYENNASWPQQVANASTFNVTLTGSETHYYLLAMGGGGQEENIGGRVNGVALDTIATMQQSSNIAGSLTGYFSSPQTINPTVAMGTYVSQLADVQAALSTATWSAPSDIRNSGVGANVTGTAFWFATENAVLFQFSGLSVGVSAVPGAGGVGLAACGMLGLRRRRRR